MFISMFVIIVFATIWVVFFKGEWNASDKSFITKVFIGEIGIAIVALFYGLFNLKQIESREGVAPSTSEPDSNTPGPDDDFYMKTYPRSQHPQFFSDVEELISHASKVTLIAVGLNLLWEKHIVDLLIRRVQDGECEVTVCMGNTASPHVEDRFIEEEMEWNRPQVGRSGVDRNIRALVERLEISGRPKEFRFLLFEHYPTFATLIFDEEIFIYPYGYQVLGNTSPIFHVKNNGSDQAKFFMNNASKIVNDAVPASDVISSRRNRRFYSDKWILAAVYIIPSAESDIYRFGSSVLGYDIYEERDIAAHGPIASVRPLVGEAASYGFHATLADALYFSSEQQVERVRAEVNFLAQEFQPFHLRGMELDISEHDPRALVIRAEDTSGVVEAIHHELVHRVYRIAVSSTYLAGRTRKALPANDSRSQLMLNRYGSPFILNNFRLHFTVCGSLPDPEAEREAAVDALRQQFDKVVDKSVEVDKLVLVVKRPGEERWTIEGSFPLCGPRWA
ncbi:DUF1045 domain-containing protein [Nonomuraea bangladeshensis]|uniref:DUF1045 domain-containing protein n=1 Tax=Nonomuraea bangladeshensis TaxID=404385 RepID=UPI003C2D2745